MEQAEGRACLPEEQQNEIRQTNWTEHAERRTCLSEEGRSEIRQTDRTGYADGFACLSEEGHAEMCTHHDMGVIHEEQDSCDNCHRRDFRIDPRYKLTFTVCSLERGDSCMQAHQG
jgi:hypothetical protein